MEFYPFNKDSPYYIYRKNKAIYSDSPNAGLFKEFETNCPILSFIEYENENQYLTEIKNLVEAVYRSEVPDPNENLEDFANFLRENKENLVPKTEEQIKDQFNCLEKDFDVKTVISEFNDNLKNPVLLLESFLTIFDCPHLVKDSLCYEEIINSYIPFISKYTASGNDSEYELKVINVFTTLALNYPKDLDSYTKNVGKIIDCLTESLNHNKVICTTTVTLLRSIFMIFPEYCNELTQAKRVEKFITVSQILMFDHPFRRYMFKMFWDLQGTGFEGEHYFINLIIDNGSPSLEDYQILHDYMCQVKTIKKPFRIMRNLLQTYIYGTPFSNLAFKLITENVQYFETSQRLLNWTLRFCRRAFQWCYVADRLNKYKYRRNYIFYCMKKLSELDIENLANVINVSASSLMYAAPSPFLKTIFNYVGYDESFGREISILQFTANGMKRQLLWPQEDLRMRRRSVITPSHSLEFSEYEDNSFEAFKADEEEEESDDISQSMPLIFPEEIYSIDHELIEVDIENNLPKGSSKLPLLFLESFLIVYIILFIINLNTTV